MDYGLWTMDYGYGLWTMDYGLWTMDYGLWTMDYGHGNNMVDSYLTALSCNSFGFRRKKLWMKEKIKTFI